MAYWNRRSNYKRYRSYANRGYNGFFGRRRKRKSKYTKTEKLAFEMGQRRRIHDDIASSHDSKVYDSYCKGYQGIDNSHNVKPLFGKN